MRRDTSKEEDLSSKYPFKKQFADLWFYSEGFHGRIIFIFFLAIIISLFAMAPPYLYGLIIEDLTVLKFGNIFLFLGITALSYVLYHLLYNIVVYHTKMLSASIKNQARIKCFSHLFRLDYEFYESCSLGQIFSRIQTGAQSVREFLKTVLAKTFLQVFITISSAVVLFSIDWVVGLAAVVAYAVFLAYGIWTTERLIGLENRVQHASERTYGKVYDFFSRILTVKLLNIKDKLIAIMNASHKEILEEEKASRKYERTKVAVSDMMLDIASVMILAYLAVKVMDGMLGIGTAVMIYGFFSKFSASGKKVWGDYNDLIDKRTGMYRMSLIFSNRPGILEPKHPKDPKGWDSIRLSNVSFRYASKKDDTLKDVSLSISKGEKVAIVGLSGSGKSTLAKLLMRLYLPRKGSISLGGIDIKNVHSDTLYSLIKIVPQDNELIDTTIAENLELAAMRRVTKAEIEQALKDAALWNFVKRLSHGIDTEIGSGGVKVSGGEKQRLCIARALLSKPEILVLDEATSNLDVLTERLVHKALHNLPENITLIAITHRISSLHLFERIIVMDHGRIVGEGTHKSLLRTNKHYRKLSEASKKMEVMRRSSQGSMGNNS